MKKYKLKKEIMPDSLYGICHSLLSLMLYVVQLILMHEPIAKIFAIDTTTLNMFNFYLLRCVVSARWPVSATNIFLIWFLQLFNIK